MIETPNILLENAVPMPLSREHFRLADEMAREQTNPEKAARVRDRILAILAVRDYLQLLDIETDLQGSDSWNPALRMMSETGDLKLTGLGQLECLPVNIESVRPDGMLCAIAPEVRLERMGYLVVAIAEKEAKLLGFTETSGNGEIWGRDLQDMLAFLTYCDRLASGKIYLPQWLVNVETAGWQIVDSLWENEENTAAIATPQGDRGWDKFLKTGKNALRELLGNADVPLRGQWNAETLALRQGTRSLLPQADVARGKLIDLGVRLGQQTIALLVALTREADDRINILVQIHPAGDLEYLPPRLQLTLLQEDGTILQDVESRSQDLCVQLRRFHVSAGENFQLAIAWEEFSTTETFMT
ncbi:MAG: DUF1822 family protein [Spirulina sp.]